MKKTIILIVGVLLIGGGIVVLFKQNQHVTHAVISHQEDIWYCPMHPHYTSDRPGQCPICSMDLVKRKQETKMEESTEGMKGYVPVTLDMRQQQLIGVKTVVAKEMPIKKMIRVSGRVAHDIELYEAQLEYVSAWQQYYAYRSRRTISDEYRTDWREYTAKDSGRPKNEDYRNAQLRLIKAEYVLQHMGITEEQLTQLRQVKYGRVWVDPQLLYFHEGQSMWVYADMREDDIGYVAAGQKVIVDVTSLNKSFEGIVRSIAKSVDLDTRTVRVRIELLKVPTELTVNMLVNVTIESELNNALQLPLGAVIDSGTRQIVFVSTGDGRYEPRRVQVGGYFNGMVVINKGLKAGEEVVLDGTFMLDSESRLRSSMEGVAGDYQHE